MTLAELKATLCRSTPDYIRFELGFAQSHEARLTLVERAIDWISQELTKNRHLKVGHTEDQITIEIVSLLKALGFQASHDTQYGGHCDIVVEGKNDFLWIAEAKIDTSNTWIMQGFTQLDTRYSTGLPGQDSGEVLIYCRKPDAGAVLESWFKYLQGRRDDVDLYDKVAGSMSRRSSHKHQSTGLEFKIRHTPISFHFEPKDK